MHWFLPSLLLLVLSQGALAQYPCDAPDAVKIPVSVLWIAQGQDNNWGYQWDPDPTVGVNKLRTNICLFTANQTLLEQCGNTTTLYQYRKKHPYKAGDLFFVDTAHHDEFRKPIAVIFQSPENVCELDLQIVHQFSLGLPQELEIGYTYEELVNFGLPHIQFFGYSIKCDDTKDKVVCIKDPTKTTTTKKTTPKTTTKPCTKKWSEWAWAPGSKCSDTCGNCGKRARQRTCLTCGCTGAAKDTVSCGNPVCYYPRMTCCAGFVKKIDKATNMFICG